MSERRAEHDELRSIMFRFSAMMDIPGGPDHAGLLRERVLFAQLFNSHLAREQEEVTFVSLSDPCVAAKSRDRAGMISELRGDYSNHVRRWTPPAILSDWDGYRSAVLSLQHRLLVFMAWEEWHLPLYA